MPSTKDYVLWSPGLKVHHRSREDDVMTAVCGAPIIHPRRVPAAVSKTDACAKCYGTAKPRSKSK